MPGLGFGGYGGASIALTPENVTQMTEYNDPSIKAARDKAAQDALAKQILGTTDTSKWSGQGFGSAAQNAADMARILYNAGITDIKDFGQIDTKSSVPITEKLTVTRQDEDGNTYTIPASQAGIVRGPDGKLATVTSYNYDGYPDGYTPLSDAQAAQVNVKQGYIYSDPDYGDVFTPITEEQSKQVQNGQLSLAGPKAYGNKATGQALTAGYDRAGGQIWSGTFAGQGSTGYGVQFDDKGNPYFYTQYGGSTNDLANLLSNPVINFVANAAAAITGGPLGVAALQGANTIANGGSIEDALKSAAKGAATAYAGGQIAGGVSSNLADTLGTTGANLAGKVVASEILSGGKTDLGKLLTNAAISSGIGGLTNTGPSSSDMIEGYFAPGGEGYVAPTGVASDTYTPTTDYGIGADYSLFGGSTAAPSLEDMGGGQGLQVAPVDETQNVGFEPIDYSLDTTTPFDELQMPTTPNVDSMGGGQGLTVPVAGGTLTETGFIPTGTAPNLGDPDSFINKPAPGADVSAAVKAASDAADKASAQQKAAASAKAASDKAAADKAAADKAAADKAARDKAANDAFNQLKAQQAAQQAQQDALMKMMSSNNDVAHIKSDTSLFGAIPGMEPPASSAQQTEQTPSWDQQFASGGHVNDFDVDALLHILRS